MKNTVKLAFGKILRKYRLQQKCSQETLAELANLDRTYISQIERGLKSPSIQSLVMLAQALNTKASFLISEFESELEEPEAFSEKEGHIHENCSSGTAD